MPVCASPLTKTPSGQTANDEAEADDDDSRWRECIVGPRWPTNGVIGCSSTHSLNQIRPADRLITTMRECRRSAPMGD